jgi:hypothetical protein
MKMKKLMAAMIALLCVCMCLTSCRSKAADVEGNEGDVAVPPELLMSVQIYKGDSIIEIPQFISDEPSDTLETINKRILEFAGDYDRFVGTGYDGDEWIELKCYPFIDDRYIQAVLTRVVYPNYGTYGEAESFCYDYIADKELTLEEAAATEGSDASVPDDALKAAVSAGEPALTAEIFDLRAAVVSELGNVYFYNVIFEPVEGDDTKLHALYARLADGSYMPYDNDILPFGVLNSELPALDPPLHYGKKQI